MYKKLTKTPCIDDGKKRAVIYARYSSFNQNEQSIEGQIHVINEYAQKEGYTIINTYVDRAMTGTNDDRPDFQKMISDSYSHAFQYVLVYKFDRFARNKYDSVINKKRLKDNGVLVVSATEMIIPDTPEGKLMESLMEGMAEYYSEELAQKVARGQRESRQKGLFGGGTIPFGYDVKDHRLVINEKEAYFVKKMFTDCANGKFIKDIIADITKLGVKTKQGKDFDQPTVSKILNNIHYTGIAVYDNVTYDKIFPKIVEKEIFDICKEKNQRNLGRKGSYKKTKVSYPLSGKCTCMYCHGPVIGDNGTSSNHGKRYFYYKCKQNKYNITKCQLRTFRKADLENLVVKSIVKYILNPQVISGLSKQITDIYNKNIKSNPELEMMKKQAKEVDKQIQNTLNVVKSGSSNKLILDMLDNLQKRKEELEIQIAKADVNQETEITTEEVEMLFRFISHEVLVEHIDRKRLIDTFIRKVEVSNDELRISFITTQASINSVAAINDQEPVTYITMDGQVRDKSINEKKEEPKLGYNNNNNFFLELSYDPKEELYKKKKREKGDTEDIEFE